MFTNSLAVKFRLSYMNLDVYEFENVRLSHAFQAQHWDQEDQYEQYLWHNNLNFPEKILGFLKTIHMHARASKLKFDF